MPEAAWPGHGLGVTRRSDWMVVDQAMIDRFADVTRDHQGIHVDRDAAAKAGLDCTIAHGFLTLSLLPHLTASLQPVSLSAFRMAMNYGFDRIRFVHPVRSGARIRLVSTLAESTEKRPGQWQQRSEVTVEIENETRPALTASWIVMVFV